MHPLRHIPVRTAAIAAGLTAATALALATVAAPAGAATGAPGTDATAEYQAALKAVGSQGVHFASDGQAERGHPRRDR